ncbi:MAG: hypothetical protein HY361_00975 [Candidatus Aenigmarchaeota archaeon]|nr:hypothetical protein [Candidatus Aenigmarchaeota archaeon]
MQTRKKNSKEKEMEEFLKRLQIMFAKAVKKGERKYKKFYKNKVAFKGEIKGICPYQAIEFKDREGKNELEIPVSFRIGDKVKITIEKGKQ